MSEKKSGDSEKSKRKSKAKTKNTGFALACWMLVALILLVFFFVKKDTLVSNLKDTDFFNRVFGKTPQFVEKRESKRESAQDDGLIQIEVEEEKPQAGASADENVGEAPARSADEGAQEAEKPSERQSPPQPAKKEEKAPEKKQAASAVEKKSEAQKSAGALATAKLCFVSIDSDGSVSRKIVSRSMAKSQSPLTDAINALLSGPSRDDQSKGCMTLIPQGTKLLGASVTNGIARLDFSEEFEFNPIGVEGYMGQLMQVVYTATSYSTVNSVQFIIAGQRMDYLGSEGEWIGSPLSRASFQ